MKLNILRLENEIEELKFAQSLRKRSSFSSTVAALRRALALGLHSAAARPDLARRCFCTETNLVRRVREHPAQEMSHDRDN